MNNDDSLSDVYKQRRQKLLDDFTGYAVGGDSSSWDAYIRGSIAAITDIKPYKPKMSVIQPSYYTTPQMFKNNKSRDDAGTALRALKFDVDNMIGATALDNSLPTKRDKFGKMPSKSKSFRDKLTYTL